MSLGPILQSRKKNFQRVANITKIGDFFFPPENLNFHLSLENSSLAASDPDSHVAASPRENCLTEKLSDSCVICCLVPDLLHPLPYVLGPRAVFPPKF